MGFTDTLKRSLGFEETESSSNGEGNFSNIIKGLSDEFKREIKNLKNPSDQHAPSQGPEQDIPNPQSAPEPSQEPMPESAPVYDEYGYDDYDDDFVITPQQSFYEIILIRPRSIDDVNYVVDQIVEEKNPVILDLAFLERESPANFRRAVEKIKQLRESYGAQALLLSRTEEKDLIIIAPNKVQLINKN